MTLYSAVKGNAILSDICISDLKLWIKIINKSIAGSLIRKLILYLPTIIYFTNSSSRAMRDFNFFSGQIWNYIFPNNIL